MIKFNQNVSLNPHIDIDTDLKKSKKWFWNFFFELLNNVIFGKTMENVRKQRDIKLFTIERRRKYLVLQPNFHTINFFTQKLLAIKMRKKTQILVNKPVYWGLSILELSEILMCKFWYDYVKPKAGEKAKFCYMDARKFL